MKNYLLIIVAIILFSCESKESINQQINELEAQILVFKNSSDVLSYNSAVAILNSDQMRMDDLKKSLNKEESEINIIGIETMIEGLETAIEVGIERINFFETKFKAINDSIKIRENKIINLENKLN